MQTGVRTGRRWEYAEKYGTGRGSEAGRELVEFKTFNQKVSDVNF